MLTEGSLEGNNDVEGPGLCVGIWLFVGKELTIGDTLSELETISDGSALGLKSDGKLLALGVEEGTLDEDGEFLTKGAVVGVDDVVG